MSTYNKLRIDHETVFNVLRETFFQVGLFETCHVQKFRGEVCNLLELDKNAWRCFWVTKVQFFCAWRETFYADFTCFWRRRRVIKAAIDIAWMRFFVGCSKMKKFRNTIIVNVKMRIAYASEIWQSCLSTCCNFLNFCTLSKSQSQNWALVKIRDSLTRWTSS